MTSTGITGGTEKRRDGFEPQPSLRTLAIEALSDSDGKVSEAVELLIERINGDRSILRGIIDEAVTLAASVAVRERITSERSRIIATTSNAKDGVMALASGLKRAILDFPLASGTKLRDAFPDEVMRQISTYERIGNETLRRARWLSAIIDGVPRTKRIGDVVTDKRAQKLWEQTA